MSQVKSLGLGKIRPALKKAIESPDARAVDNAVALLEAIGALDPKTEDLTNLGEMLSELPVHPQVW